MLHDTHSSSRFAGHCLYHGVLINMGGDAVICIGKSRTDLLH